MNEPNKVEHRWIESIRKRTPILTHERFLAVLPLEPMAERYTEQWWNWFGLELRRLGIDYAYFAPDLENVHSVKVQTGTVLDATGTIVWKMRQLANFAEWLQENRAKYKDITVFTMDLQHPGIESIRYMCDQLHKPVRVFGFLHASSYLKEDFASPMAPWMSPFDYAWVHQADGVFLGSEYHKQLLIQERSKIPWEWKDKLIVTRAPFMEEIGIIPSERDITVIWPHRFDREKRPMRALEIFKQLKDLHPDWTFVVCTSRPLLGESPIRFNTNDDYALKALNELHASGTVEFIHCPHKSDYYDLLARSKCMLSTTIEETFGYCFVESIAHGVYPIVPEGFSHVEFFSQESDPLGTMFKRDDFIDVFENAVKRSFNHTPEDIEDSWSGLLTQSWCAIETMVKKMFPGSGEQK